MKEYPNCIIPPKGRGFFGIGIECAASSRNIGTIWRSAQVFGADFMFIIGKRYETMRTDTMKSWRHIPLFEYPDLAHFAGTIPKDTTIIGVELDERSRPLMSYKHPQRAVYLLGSEDRGLSEEALKACNEIVQIPGKFSLNVSVAASIILYDRLLKRTPNFKLQTSMKLAYKYRFCIWLVDSLSRKPMTFAEISEKWIESSANESATAITERTFNRYRLDAEIMMNLDIVCDKADGYRYHVKVSDFDMQTKASEWMLTAFRISNLTAGIKQKGNVVLESAPPGAHLLATIAEAIDNGYSVKFTYKSHYHSVGKEIELIPAFVRLYKQRWYVIGKLKTEERAKTFAFERMDCLEVVPEKSVLSKLWRDQLSPSEYFKHCYGIIRQHEPIRICFRAFFPQDAYIRDVPVHASQKELYSCPDYADFEIFVRPTYDLKQELLWHRDKLAVLSPDSFREDMINVLKATLENYETGQNNAIDE